MIAPPEDPIVRQVPHREAMPEELVERLADLWCEVLLANLRRHPIVVPPEERTSR
jgi:hypothetical protein